LALAIPSGKATTGTVPDTPRGVPGQSPPPGAAPGLLADADARVGEQGLAALARLRLRRPALVDARGVGRVAQLIAQAPARRAEAHEPRPAMVGVALVAGLARPDGDAARRAVVADDRARLGGGARIGVEQRAAVGRVNRHADGDPDDRRRRG